MASAERVASLYADVGMNISKAQAASREMSSRLLTLQNQFKTVRDQAKITGTGITQAFATGVGIGAAVKAAEGLITAVGQISGAFTGAIESVADYDKNLNTFRFLTSASAATMAQASSVAKALGTDLKLPQYSAADAAAAMLDLAKAGISAEDAIAGARPALLLAAAGESSAADAATLLANTLNEFSLKGSDAGKVADEITAAMKHSGQSLTEMSDALAQGGATFKQANQPLDTFLTLVAELGKAGIRGSQAGNTLNQMMQSMIAPTDEARGLMAGLGVHVYELGTNKMRPFRDILKEMTPALQRLNEAQRNQYLSTIFGSNAVRAASIVFGQGTDAFDQMAASLTEVGVAEGLAGAKADSLAGALADIKKEFNTAIFSAIEPFKDEIKGAAQDIGSMLQDLVKLTQATDKTKVGLMGVAVAFALMGAASVASGDLGTGIEYLLIGILLIIKSVIDALGRLGDVLSGIGTLLDKVFGGNGGGGGLGGGVNVALNPVLAPESRGELQRQIDGWSPLTKLLLLEIPGVNAILVAVANWPTISKALELVPSAFENVKGWVDSWPPLVKMLTLEIPGVNVIQGMIDLWDLVAKLTTNPSERQAQDEIDRWYLDKALDLKPDRDAVQAKVDPWYLDHPIALNPDRADTQAKVDPWYLDHPIDLNPDRQLVQGKIDAWPLLRVDGSLDLSRAEAQAKVDQWPLLRAAAKFDLPSQDEVQRLINVNFPDLKLRLKIETEGSPYPKGVEPPQPSAPSVPSSPAHPQPDETVIGGPDSLGRYNYQRRVPFMGGWSVATEWRAKGGPVEAGKPYIVGEQGPEPFIPSSNGTILPNDALGGDTINVYIQNLYGDDLEDRVVGAIKTAKQKGRLTSA